VNISQHDTFYQVGIVSSPQNTPAAGPPIDCLLNIFAATLHIGGLSSILKPEDAACHVDRNPNIKGENTTIVSNIT